MAGRGTRSGLSRCRPPSFGRSAIDPDDILTQYNVACVYTLMGDYDRAFDLLESLLPHANHKTKSWIKHDSDFDALRTQARYSNVLALIE